MLYHILFIKVVKLRWHYKFVVLVLQVQRRLGIKTHTHTHRITLIYFPTSYDPCAMCGGVGEVVLGSGTHHDLRHTLREKRQRDQLMNWAWSLEPGPPFYITPTLLKKKKKLLIDGGQFNISDFFLFSCFSKNIYQYSKTTSQLITRRMMFLQIIQLSTLRN